MPGLTDDDVPAYWQSLGLPGLIDIHVHVLPPTVMSKVRAYFDRAERHYGVAWPVTYRGDDAERLELLRALGVRAFPALAYAHKPGMAEWLNDWTREFARGVPECVPALTFFPEPGVLDYVRRALDDGARVAKVHLQVGGFDPRDPQLGPVWGLLADARIPVVTHCGSGPLPGHFTGPAPIGEVVRRHPALRLVVAHFGSPEYAAFVDLAETYPNVCLDTTMAFTDFMQERAPVPPEVVMHLPDLQDRVVLGSDFPNIPYAYARQIEALDRLELGDEWLRAVLWHNGARLLGIDS